MKTIIALTALLLSAAGAVAYDGKYLNVALFGLPARYLADVPIENRGTLLVKLSRSPFEDKRLDYDNGWIHYFSDGGDHESGEGRPSSMFYVKLLFRKSQSPLVFVHMPKPFADGSVPGTNQTFILGQDGNEWKDATKSLIPKGVDLTAHFRPRRSSNVIEVAPYERVERQDGRGSAYKFGEHTFDLVWDGTVFELRNASSAKLSVDD